MDNQLSLFGFEEPVAPKQPAKNVSEEKGKDNVEDNSLEETVSESVDQPDLVMIDDAKKDETIQVDNDSSEHAFEEETTKAEAFLEGELNEVVQPNKTLVTIDTLIHQASVEYPIYDPIESEESEEDSISPIVESEKIEETTAITENMPQLDEVAVPNQEVAPAENLLEKDIEDNTGEDLVLDEKNDFNQLVEVKQEEKLVEEPKPLAERFGKKGRKSFKEIDAEVDLIQVPSDEILFSKQYYPISQVAKWFRVNNSLLRFWENEFEILKPRKNRKGDRLFRPEDIKNLQIIYYLLRQKKYTIAGARKFIKNNRKTVDVNMKVVQTLNDFKRFLLELKANSER